MSYAKINFEFNAVRWIMWGDLLNLSLSIFCLNRVGSLNFGVLLSCLGGGFKYPFQDMAMGSWLMFHFIFFVSCCLKLKVQWWEWWKHNHFMWMFSMCKDIICELFMCKVFFLSLCDFFLCEPLYLQNSMHDFCGINTKDNPKLRKQP
jgi:hypothetical protein